MRAVPVPGVVPADLLGRRADIVAARWRVEAATHDVASARAQFYPNVNLVAFVGLSSIGFNRFFEPGSEQWGFGPAISLPIFESGRLRANLSGKSADLDVAIESYNGNVIDAVHDVADQITSARSIERQQRQQAEALASAESAYDARDAALSRRPVDVPDGAQCRDQCADATPPRPSTCAPACSTRRCCWCAPSAAATRRAATVS